MRGALPKKRTLPVELKRAYVHLFSIHDIDLGKKGS